MNATKYITLATEDELSEVIAQRLISLSDGRLAPSLCLRQGGQGYIKSRMKNFCEMAINQPVLIITDLDTCQHPKILIDKLVQNYKRPKNLVIRIAVREIESWILADHQAVSQLLTIPPNKIPEAPDNILDPKSALLNLAKKAPREIKSSLVAQAGTVAGQGIGYNRILVDFAKNQWCPRRASDRSNSLYRAINRILDIA